jgi:hypothetical protein
MPNVGGMPAADTKVILKARGSPRLSSSTRTRATRKSGCRAPRLPAGLHRAQEPEYGQPGTRRAAQPGSATLANAARSRAATIPPPLTAS